MTHDVRSEGDTEDGAGSRAKSVSRMWETQEGQCRLDIRKELVIILADEDAILIAVAVYQCIDGVIPCRLDLRMWVEDIGR